MKNKKEKRKASAPLFSFEKKKKTNVYGLSCKFSCGLYILLNLF